MSRWTALLPWAMGLAVAGTLVNEVLFAAEPQPSATRKPVPPVLIRGVMTGEIKVLEEVGANSCLLWGPPRRPEDWDQLLQAGQFVFLNDLGGPPKEFFDFEGSKRVRLRVPFCYSGDWGRWWVDHVKLAAAGHYPAICSVTTDEWAWNNAHVPYLFGIRQPVGTRFYCDCTRCRKALGELPEPTASRFLTDSDAARRFIRCRYHLLADTLKDALDRARETDPSFLAYYTLNLREVLALERYPYGVALDLLPRADILLATAFQTSVDRRGPESRFVQPQVVKHLLAARPRLGAVPALAATVYDYRQKYDWTEAYHWRKDVEDLLPRDVAASIRRDLEPYVLRDDDVVLPALSCIAHGARGVMFFGDDRREALKKLFTLMARIEKEMNGASVPGEVVVLCSRQSQDEWMLRHSPGVGSREDLSDAMMQVGCWAQPADRIAWEFNRNAPHAQGFRSTASAMEALLRLGIPFRLHFVEDLQTSDLAQARVAVVPFCTHLSERAATIVRDFAARRKVIVFAHRAEYDEDGGRRRKPALDTGTGLVFFESEASEFLRDPAGRRKLADAIGDVSDTHVTCPAESVERAWLKLAHGGVAVFVINWAEESAAVRLRLPGTGKATLFDTSGNTSEVDRAPVVEVPGRDARIIIQSGREAVEGTRR